MSEQNNDEARARAAELRKKIDELRQGKSDSGTANRAPSTEEKKPESPRQFIQDRMRELDQKRDKPSS